MPDPDTRNPKTWSRHIELAEAYEKQAVDAEWAGQHEEANRLYALARHHRAKHEAGEDLDVPF